MPPRFASTWSIEESTACFIVRDRDKQARAYVYYENEAGRTLERRSWLTRDEAFLIAVGEHCQWCCRACCGRY